MHFHRNAKLGLSGRHELVLQIAAGASIRSAAAIFNVSTATAHRWSKRWQQASAAERRSLSCLFDRSSRPARSPRRLAPDLERTICDCRRKTGWGPRLVAGATGFCHSTVWKVLRRFGLSGRHDLDASRPTATSGRVLAISCTWTCLSTCASSSPATGSLEIAPRRITSPTVSTTCMRSSTTTHGWPTPRSMATQARRRLPASASVRLPSMPPTGSQRVG